MTLGKRQGTLDLSVWSDIINDALNYSYGQIVAGLTARGFSQNIIPYWDRGAEFQKSLAMYWALLKRGSIGPDDQFSTANIDRLNVLDQLNGNPAKNIQAVYVTINGGVPADPDLQYGQAVSGPDTGKIVDCWDGFENFGGFRS